MLSLGSFYGARGKTPTRTSKLMAEVGKQRQIKTIDVNCKQQVLHEKAQQVTKNQSTHEIL